MARTSVRLQWWPFAMLAAAAVLVLGGLLHPQEDEALSGLAQTHAWLGDPMWVPSHLLLLLAEVLLIAGLVGLVSERRDLPVWVRRVAWVARGRRAVGRRGRAARARRR